MKELSSSINIGYTFDYQDLRNAIEADVIYHNLFNNSLIRRSGDVSILGYDMNMSMRYDSYYHSHIERCGNDKQFYCMVAIVEGEQIEYDNKSAALIVHSSKGQLSEMEIALESFKLPILLLEPSIFVESERRFVWKSVHVIWPHDDIKGLPGESSRFTSINYGQLQIPADAYLQVLIKEAGKHLARENKKEKPVSDNMPAAKANIIL